jgi:hypothetical protein
LTWGSSWFPKQHELTSYLDAGMTWSSISIAWHGTPPLQQDLVFLIVFRQLHNNYLNLTISSPNRIYHPPHHSQVKRHWSLNLD